LGSEGSKLFLSRDGILVRDVSDPGIGLGQLQALWEDHIRDAKAHGRWASG
jgi:hypothetical protein